MSKELIQKEGPCLNCGTEVQGNYCSNCGQKFQPTKLPLKQFLEDAVETLFNIDNRLFITLRDLFLKPGKITLEYLEGKRATYLPPVRIYLSISVIYFVLAQLIESTKVFFINFGTDSQTPAEVAEKIQYSLFFLVPVMAAIIQLFYRKRKGFYVEYLIFSMHIHSVWFVLISFDTLSEYMLKYVEESFSSVPYILILIISTVSQLLTFLYLAVSQKKVFRESWGKTILKTIGIVFLYFIILAFVAVIIIGLI